MSILDVTPLPGDARTISELADDALDCFDYRWHRIKQRWIPVLVDAPQWLEQLAAQVSPFEEPDVHALRTVAAALDYIATTRRPSAERFANRQRHGIRATGDDRQSWFESSATRRAYCRRAIKTGVCKRRTSNYGYDRRGIGYPLAGAGIFLEALEVYALTLEALRTEAC